MKKLDFLHSGNVWTVLTVPSLVCSDETEVLTLRFSAFPHAAADTALEFVRRANALVSLLQLNGHCTT